MLAAEGSQQQELVAATIRGSVLFCSVLVSCSINASSVIYTESDSIEVKTLFHR